MAKKNPKTDTRATMKLKKGGVSTSFSKVTDGERLRLKLAVVIALIRLGETQGIGRHPGLLLIDSPGSQETSEQDVTQILRELVEVCKEVSHLQIITASAQGANVEAILPKDRIRSRPKGQTLWG